MSCRHLRHWGEFEGYRGSIESTKAKTKTKQWLKLSCCIFTFLSNKIYFWRYLLIYAQFLNIFPYFLSTLWFLCGLCIPCHAIRVWDVFKENVTFYAIKCLFLSNFNLIMRILPSRKFALWELNAFSKDMIQ